MKTWWIYLLAALCVAMALTGCSKSNNTFATAAACAQAFDAAMKAGDADKAVGCWEFEKLAREQSTDWDTYGESQRDLILAKQRDAEEAELKQWTAKYAFASYQIGPAQITGSEATVSLTSRSGGSVMLQLTNTARGWRIYAAQVH